MALSEGQVQVRGLVMGPGTDYETLRGFNPWAVAARVDQSSARSGDHGSWSGAEWRDEVVVPIPLRVRSRSDRSVAGWVPAHQALMAAFAPSHTDVEMRWCTGGVEYVMFGRPRVVEPEVESAPAGWTVTRCGFAALDPRIYSGVEQVASVGLPSSIGGLTWPTTWQLLNSNPYFETNVTGWTATGGTITRSTVRAHEGAASGLLTPDGVTAAARVFSAESPAAPGRQYQTAAWVWCAVARNVEIRALWYDAAHTVISVSTAILPVPAATWTPLFANHVAPSGTTGTAIQLWMDGTPAASHLLHVDEATISELRGGLTWPVTWNAVVSSGVIQVHNEGTAAARPRLVIYGPCTKPRVSLVGAGRTLAWDLTLAAGQWLDVDTDRRTSLINGQVSRSGQMTSRQWFELPPGQSEIAFNADVYDPAAALHVAYRSAW